MLQDGAADLVALGGDGTVWIIEIKSSLADLRADGKWPDYRRHCDRLYFAIPSTMPPEVMPADAGLIVADADGAAILRDPDEHRIPPATRRALTLHFARAAAARRCCWPERSGPAWRWCRSSTC